LTDSPLPFVASPPSFSLMAARLSSHTLNLAASLQPLLFCLSPVLIFLCDALWRLLQSLVASPVYFRPPPLFFLKILGYPHDSFINVALFPIVDPMVYWIPRVSQVNIPLFPCPPPLTMCPRMCMPSECEHEPQPGFPPILLGGLVPPPSIASSCSGMALPPCTPNQVPPYDLDLQGSLVPPLFWNLHSLFFFLQFTSLLSFIRLPHVRFIPLLPFSSVFRGPSSQREYGRLFLG